MPNLSNVTTAFSSAQIVPDVLPSFSPTDGVNLTFTDPVSMQSVDVVPGLLLTMGQTSMPPDITLVAPSADSGSNASFVVVLLDPDAPTPQNPNVSEFLHFLGGDFSADSTSGLLSNSTPALMEFFPPTPPPGSDPHRYVLLVFNQPDSFDVDAPTLINATTPRTNFSVTDFAQAVDLGDAIAGNYFLVGPTNLSTPTMTGTAANQPTTPSIPLTSPSSSSSGDTLSAISPSTTPSAVVTAPNNMASSPSSANANKLRTSHLIAIAVVMVLCVV
ncbi:hypothetical protein CVT25_011021 [Psilocybe cyanescens]|uniref:PEBP-like protein n=1 Tax=Psilocybe cyanescens TaxID=93625 RepID=A0A409WFY8_PSICY|nr:hypothetical protein CVT25_011021 [Psilocybe cyanescens]